MSEYPRFRMLAVSRIAPNAWNPNEQSPEVFSKEIQSIRKHGFVVPLVVRPDGDDWAIIDGEHRWRAAKQLGITEVPVYDVGPIPDAAAKELTVLLNELRGEPNPRKLSGLLRDLVATSTIEDLLKTLPYSPDEFRERAGLDDFDWGDFERKMEATPSGEKSKWKELTFRLPAEAAEVVDEALAKAKKGLDTRAQDWQALEVIAAEFLAIP